MENDLFMIGELSKKMGVSVRTLQYYDKKGLLNPSGKSEGGRRLYSSKDIITLHQILSMKDLGFSLDEIKSMLLTLDTPKEVAEMLVKQKNLVDNKVLELQKISSLIDNLHTEVLQINQVDFKKYAEIITMIKSGNEAYWSWKYFDDTLQNHIINRYGDNADDGLKIYETYKEVIEEALILKHENELPDSEKSLALAKKWWNMIMDFTGGDMSLIPQLEKFNENKDNWDNDFADKQKELDEFLETILSCYFEKVNGG